MSGRTFQWILENKSFLKGSKKAYVICNNCEKTKLVKRHSLRRRVKRGNKNYFCSSKCSITFQKGNAMYPKKNKLYPLNCTFCQDKFYLKSKPKGKLHFCGSECQVNYFNAKNNLAKIFDFAFGELK